jgi:peptide/nickel transport system substrate-binding protein
MRSSSRKTHRERFRLPGLSASGIAIMAAVAIAGCGSSSSSGGSSSPSASSGSSSSADSTLIVAEPNDIQNLDPTESSGDTVTQEMLTNVYSWLNNYKVEDVNGQMEGNANSFIPSIAKSMTYNKSHTVLTFQIRKGLKFANGDPLTAKAVEYSYQRIFKQDGVTASLLGMAGVSKGTDVTMTGPYTIQFHISKANNLLMGNIAQFGNSILDPKIIEAKATKKDPYAHNYLADNVGGNAEGPYELQSWQPGVQFVLTANPNYTYGPAPKIKKIIFKIIPNASTRYELLESGAVDIAYNLPLKDVAAAKSNAALKIYNEPSRYVVFLGMNSQDKPWNNVDVRKAVDYAVPYNTIIKQVLEGYGSKMTSPVPIGTPTHTDKFDVYNTDLTKAKQLLKAAGYANGFSTTLTVSSGDEEGQETAIYVQEYLKKIGINVTIDQVPGASYNAKLQAHQLSFFYFDNWISINNDPFYHLYWLFTSSCCDYTNYKNPTVDKIVNKELLEPASAARNAASVKVQKDIMADAPWAFLFQPNWVVAMRADVKGYVYFPSDTFTRYQYLYKTG